MKRLLTLIQALGASIGAIKSNQQAQIKIGESMRSYLSNIEIKISNEGKVQACRHFKQLHLIAIALATKHATLPVIPFCKTDNRGIPLALRPVKWLLLHESQDFQRIGLTITRSFESIVLPALWDPAPITEKGPILSPQLIKDFTVFCQYWCDGIKARNLVPPSSDVIKGNLVKGPNGPSILTSHYDAKAILGDQDLLENLGQLASLTGNEWIWELMVNLGAQVPGDNYLSGRISLLQEGGGKTRVIAIGDYWSQNLLSPIHKKLMDVLRRLVTDGTYGQEKQVERIQRESLGHKTYSYDLTSATDRFPVRIQEILLSFVFNPEIASVWRKVLTQRSYAYKDEMVSWAVGQPLGMLSSWAAFSLTHHCFIEFAAARKGIKSFRDYAVLGDDVVIWNEMVAQEYADLCKEIGLTINLAKSLISDDQNHRVEFAKRIILNGVEISGLKANILNKASRSIYMLIDLIRVAQLRSWDLPWTEIQAPSFLSVKGKELLAILLWEQGQCDAPNLTGSHHCRPSIEELKRKVLELRLASLKEKQDSLDAFLCAAKPIQDLFKREGVYFSESMIGLGKWSDPLHPAVWHLNSMGEELAIALSLLESVSTGEDQSTPEMLPIEYLPIPNIEVYFGDRHSLKSIAHSRIVLKAWFQLISQSQPEPVESV
jgi:hypothetical protein